VLEPKINFIYFEFL